VSCRRLSPNRRRTGLGERLSCLSATGSPKKTALWGLLDTLYERVKGSWEERFERRYGFWRGLADEAVARYRQCPLEFLAAFSCKGRGLCPSCGSKRAAELAAFLTDEVVEDVGHAQWVFTIPKMLRVYFLHHRELLGKLSQAAAEIVRGAGRRGGAGEPGRLKPADPNQCYCRAHPSPP
jgi:hypothetical protein